MKPNLTTIHISYTSPRKKPQEGDIRRLKTKTLIRTQQRSREGHRLVSRNGPRWEWISPEEYQMRHGRLPEGIYP